MENKGKIAGLAHAQGKTKRELLTEMFEQHKTVSRVARALGVSNPSVSITLLREGLEISVTLIKAKRKTDR
jgi:transposase-like protein